MAVRVKGTRTSCRGCITTEGRYGKDLPFDRFPHPQYSDKQYLFVMQRTPLAFAALPCIVESIDIIHCLIQLLVAVKSADVNLWRPLMMNLAV